ncbi:hypothetical protein ABPG72_010508 [Tetrahymena utriculariae]
MHIQALAGIFISNLQGQENNNQQIVNSRIQLKKIFQFPQIYQKPSINYMIKSLNYEEQQLINFLKVDVIQMLDIKVLKQQEDYYEVRKFKCKKQKKKSKDSIFQMNLRRNLINQKAKQQELSMKLRK